MADRPPDKSKVLGIRFPIAEIQQIEQAAAAENLKPSDWAKKVLLGASNPEPISEGTIASAWTLEGHAFHDDVLLPCILEHEVRISVNDIPVKPYQRTWADEWADLEQMDPGDASLRMEELRAGRILPPAGFRSWKKDMKIDWLNEHWPIGE